MQHLFISYLKFLYNSTNEHGVHSPFVFDLVTKCFYDKTNYSEYSILKKYRKLILENSDIIEVKDFGVGSKIFKSNKRKVAQIAKVAGISSKRAELLFRIVKYFQPNEILEIGTSLGLATSALLLGNPKANITTLEGCNNTMNIAKFELEKWLSQAQTTNNFNSINFINCEFEQFLNKQKPKLKTQNLIYFDGNHSKKATLDYFELLLPTITNDSIWIFDDIHWSTDMEKAWNIIKNHAKVRVTIDTFQWGIVFFKTEQAKEHFVIRT
jgi:predicted O-methyltransferase YrrM